MVKAATILFASLSLLGCATVDFSPNPTHDYAIVMEDGFTPDQQAAIFAAAEAWSHATGDFVRFHGAAVTDPNVPTFTITPKTMAQVKQCDPLAIAYTTDEGTSAAILLSDDSLQPATFLQMTTHEFGHALGAQHIGPGNIMCKDRDCAGTTITCADVTEMCSHWGSDCNAAAMPACAVTQ